MNHKRKFRLPRLSRRGKILSNFVLALAAALTLWGMLGWPLPTRLAYRRMEREYFLPPAQIRVVCGSTGNRQVVFAQREGRLDWGILRNGQSGFMAAMEWDGSPLLLCNGWMLHEKDGLAAAVLGAPQEAVSARLELTLTVDAGTEVPETLYWGEADPTIPETWSEHYTVQTGKRDGVFQFQIPRKHPTRTTAVSEEQRKAWNDASCEFWAVVYGMSVDGKAGYHYDMRVECLDRSGAVILTLEQNDQTGLAADFWDTSENG